MKSRTRRFRGFAVLDRPDGSLIWGTFRPDSAAAWSAYQGWNPSMSGSPQGQLVAVEIAVRPTA